MNHQPLFNQRIELKLSIAQRKAVEKYAKEHDFTMNDVVRLAINRLLEVKK